MSVPLPPQEISSDGREVWDWALRLSEYTQRIQRARELRKAISDCENTCGSCTKWMTDACPRESRDRLGRKVGGPSCNAVKCGQFVMQQYDVKRLAGLRSEYDAILKATGAQQ